MLDVDASEDWAESGAGDCDSEAMFVVLCVPDWSEVVVGKAAFSGLILVQTGILVR